MDRSTDSEVIHDAVEWLQSGARVTLVTVVNTWGSAPRRPGAIMAVRDDGRFTGSVSGGCIEDDLVHRVLRGEFEDRPPRLLEYGISTESTRRIGLPCGGRLALLVENLTSPAPLQQVMRTMDERRRIERRVCLGTGEASLHAVREPVTALRFDDDTVYKTFGPAWRLLIIGAGELARRVAQLAITLDYAVTICDSRPEYADGWKVAGTDFCARPPQVFITDFAPDSHTVVLALAHAPSLEDDALAAALASDAFYVGALGSRNNHRARLGRLSRRGLSHEQLQRLHGPVGLDIGSHTPAEIAVSIGAALVASRNASVKQATSIKVMHG